MEAFQTTAAQRLNLRVYLHFRDRPMTISGLFWASRRTYLLLTLFFGLAAALFYWLLGEIAAGFMLTAYAVLILRDIGHCRRSVQVWPMVREVLDWSKVEQLAAQQRDPSR